jgi:hypothetical protein
MARKQGTIRVRAEWWEPGEYIELRSYLSHGAKKSIEAATLAGFDMSGLNIKDMTGQDGGLDKAKVDLKAAMAAGEDASLLAMIVSWTLADEKGAILLFEPAEALQQSLDELDERDIEFIKETIDKVTGSQMSAEERANFLAKLSAGIPA